MTPEQFERLTQTVRQHPETVYRVVLNQSFGDIGPHAVQFVGRKLCIQTIHPWGIHGWIDEPETAVLGRAYFKVLPEQIDAC
jgi:hypothetical protein